MRFSQAFQRFTPSAMLGKWAPTRHRAIPKIYIKQVLTFIKFDFVAQRVVSFVAHTVALFKTSISRRIFEYLSILF